MSELGLNLWQNFFKPEPCSTHTRPFQFEIETFMAFHGFRLAWRLQAVVRIFFFVGFSESSITKFSWDSGTVRRMGRSVCRYDGASRLWLGWTPSKKAKEKESWAQSAAWLCRLISVHSIIASKTCQDTRVKHPGMPPKISPSGLPERRFSAWFSHSEGGFDFVLAFSIFIFLIPFVTTASLTVACLCGMPKNLKHYYSYVLMGIYLIWNFLNAEFPLSHPADFKERLRCRVSGKEPLVLSSLLKWRGQILICPHPSPLSNFWLLWPAWTCQCNSKFPLIWFVLALVACQWC